MFAISRLSRRAGAVPSALFAAVRGATSLAAASRAAAYAAASIRARLSRLSPDILLKERVVLVDGLSYDEASVIKSQLLLLESVSSEPINMFIDSSKRERLMSSMNSGFMIYETIQHLSCPVSTLCIGKAYFMGALLLATGTEKRCTLPHSVIIIQQPSANIVGDVFDAFILTNNLITSRDLLVKLFSFHTKNSVKTVNKWLYQDFSVTPEEAKELGLLDEILLHK